MFRLFLKHEPGFTVFSGIADSFYEDVRCGLLHQGETREGWTVMRGGPIFDPVGKQLNATRFLKAVHCALRNYCHELKHADWNGAHWRKCRQKMAMIIANCNG
jgi:hypothetical protein